MPPKPKLCRWSWPKSKDDLTILPQSIGGGIALPD
jgi:hypothetical protein